MVLEKFFFISHSNSINTTPVFSLRKASGAKALFNWVGGWRMTWAKWLSKFYHRTPQSICCPTNAHCQILPVSKSWALRKRKKLTSSLAILYFCAKLQLLLFWLISHFVCLNFQPVRYILNFICILMTHPCYENCTHPCYSFSTL